MTFLGKILQRITVSSLQIIKKVLPQIQKWYVFNVIHPKIKLLCTGVTANHCMWFLPEGVPSVIQVEGSDNYWNTMVPRYLIS